MLSEKRAQGINCLILCSKHLVFALQALHSPVAYVTNNCWAEWLDPYFCHSWSASILCLIDQVWQCKLSEELRPLRGSRCRCASPQSTGVVVDCSCSGLLGSRQSMYSGTCLSTDSDSYWYYVCVAIVRNRHSGTGRLIFPSWEK